MSTIYGITLGASFGLVTVSPFLAILLFAVSASGLMATTANNHYKRA